VTISGGIFICISSLFGLLSVYEQQCHEVYRQVPDQECTTLYEQVKTIEILRTSQKRQFFLVKQGKLKVGFLPTDR
jgi:hypothetical protein